MNVSIGAELDDGNKLLHLLFLGPSITLPHMRNPLNGKAWSEQVILTTGPLHRKVAYMASGKYCCMAMDARQCFLS
jgi:hypothetical protein